MDITKKKYKYASRVVTPIKEIEDVDKELDYIYRINNDGEDIMSIQVIPQFTNPSYPALPTFFVISYIYRYEVGDEENA